MAKVSHLKNNNQREVVKIFLNLSGKYSLWQLWSDFIVMAAISISNVVDKLNAPKREEQYMNIVKRYDNQTIKNFPKILSLIIEGMDFDPDRDFLGEIFMELNLGNDAGGQFFTPYNVCKMMAEINKTEEIVKKIEKDRFVSVNDCAYGAGATLIAFANTCKLHNINYQTDVLFIAQDIDFVTACMCYLQLSLLGCSGYVFVGDTITNPCLTADKKGLLPLQTENVWFTPMFYSDTWTARKLFARMSLLENPTETQKTEPAEKISSSISDEILIPELIESKSGQFKLF